MPRAWLASLLICATALAGDHPGNVFVEGGEVSVSALAPIQLHGWKLLDYDGKTISESKSGAEAIALGKLPIGYYELHSGSERITFGVIAPLRAPTPQTSPISIDVAMAWFYHTPQQQRAAAKLCTLAGVNWV